MKLSVVVTFVNISKLQELLELLDSKYNFEVIVVDSDIYKEEIADVCRTYKAYYLVIGSTKDKQYFERVEDIVRGDWLAFLDGDCIPELGWIDEIYRIVIKYNPFLLGGPIDIKIKDGFQVYDENLLKGIAKNKWPFQMINQIKLRYQDKIISEEIFRIVCSSNMIVSKENLKKLNKDKVRIGYIGEGTKMDEHTSLIGNGLFYSKRMGVIYEA